MIEPDDAEEELLALRGAVDGARGPAGVFGCLGLLGAGLFLLTSLPFLLGRMGTDGFVVGLLYVVFGVMYGLAPGVLFAYAMQRPVDYEDARASLRQARLLTVYWWLIAASALGFGALYGLLLLGVLLGFALR